MSANASPSDDSSKQETKVNKFREKLDEIWESRYQARQAEKELLTTGMISAEKLLVGEESKKTRIRVHSRPTLEIVPANIAQDTIMMKPKFTKTQTKVLDLVRENKSVLIYGKPATGKTFVLEWATMYLARLGTKAKVYIWSPSTMNLGQDHGYETPGDLFASWLVAITREAQRDVNVRVVACIDEMPPYADALPLLGVRSESCAQIIAISNVSNKKQRDLEMEHAFDECVTLCGDARVMMTE